MAALTSLAVATDDERVYVSFGGNVGVFCYTYDGELIWKRTWPPQPMFHDFGTASSPVVHDGRVYQLGARRLSGEHMPRPSPAQRPDRNRAK